MNRVIFHADGGLDIGMGHIMRSAALAKEFKRNNWDVVFASPYIKTQTILMNTGIRFLQLNDISFINQSKKLAEEFGDGYNLIISDGYEVDEKYFEILKASFKHVAYMDDLNLNDWKVDIIINSLANAKELNFNATLSRKLLLGAQYLPMREEFTDLPQHKIDDRITKVMISTGGSDSYSLSEKIVNTVLNNVLLKDTQIKVIVGHAFGDITKLEHLEKSYPNVLLVKTPPLMSEVMKWADLCISAGGLTLYELCACGTPIIAFYLADNQISDTAYLADNDFIISVGWYYDMLSGKLQAAINQMINKNIRQEFSIKGQSLIDGKGTKRVYKEVVSYINKD